MNGILSTLIGYNIYRVPKPSSEPADSVIADIHNLVGSIPADSGAFADFIAANGGSGYLYYMTSVYDDTSSGASNSGDLSPTTSTYSYGNAWNMISIPAGGETFLKNQIFPAGISNAYGYGPSGYYTKDSLEPGNGYWVKFGAAGTFDVTGFALAAESVRVRSGWNLIGSISGADAVSSIMSDPPAIITSQAFQYSSGYKIADSILPGRGYWLKTNRAGTIYLAVSSPSADAAIKSNPTGSGMNPIDFRDARGNSQTLYLGHNLKKPGRVTFVLPPPPPAGAFDARYESGTYAEDVESGAKRKPIIISSTNYPVTIKWQGALIEGHSASLMINGKTYPLSSAGSVTLSHAGAEVLVSIDGAGKNVLPDRYALGQNYPNPFNPSTVLRYQLPLASFVTLRIYDMLGREVTTLADENQDAGFKQVEWDAAAFPSGIYFYRLEAVSSDGSRKTFGEIRKMLLLR